MANTVNCYVATFISSVLLEKCMECSNIRVFPVWGKGYYFIYFLIKNLHLKQPPTKPLHNMSELLNVCMNFHSEWSSTRWSEAKEIWIVQSWNLQNRWGKERRGKRLPWLYRYGNLWRNFDVFQLLAAMSGKLDLDKKLEQDEMDGVEEDEWVSTLLGS